MKIYLARHGQDEDNAKGILNGHRDTPLTAIGTNQAQTVADKIQKAGLTFDAIYSSPLQRAKSTAQIIMRATLQQPPSSNTAQTNIPQEQRTEEEVVVLSELIERDFGIMTGLPVNEILKRCGEENVLKTDTITYFLHPPQAETFDDLMTRANRLLSKLQQLQHDSILLVTHGDFGKMLYAAYYQIPWRDVLKQFHFGNSEVLLLSKDSSPEDCAHVFEIEQHNS